MSVRSRSRSAKEGKETRQLELDSFGIDLEEYRRLWNPQDRNQGSDWEVFTTGEPLFNPDYEAIPFVIVTGEDVYDNPKGSNIKHQSLESNLFENGDRENFEEIAEALENPSKTDFWYKFSDKGQIPLRQEMKLDNTVFHVEKIRKHQNKPEHLYPISEYFETMKKPSAGQEVQLSRVKENLRDEDRANFKYVVSQLKDIGATVYVTGSITEKGNEDYDDIDIAVQENNRKAEDVPDNSIELKRVKWFIEDLTEESSWRSRYTSEGGQERLIEKYSDSNSYFSPEEQVEQSLESFDTASWGGVYGHLNIVYTVELEDPASGNLTEFDIASAARPIINKKGDSEAQKYARI